MKEIPILKTGRYTDANGRTYDITQAMLDDIAKNTLPNSAPLVKGHPSADAPALGWKNSAKPSRLHPVKRRGSLPRPLYKIKKGLSA